jgi:hypothetical protein
VSPFWLTLDGRLQGEPEGEREGGGGGDAGGPPEHYMARVSIQLSGLLGEGEGPLENAETQVSQWHPAGAEPSWACGHARQPSQPPRDQGAGV